MLLADWEIEKLCVPVPVPDYKTGQYRFRGRDGQSEVLFEPMIEPFSPGISGEGIISYGLTSAGYDLRMGSEVLVFKNTFGEAVDPKRFKDSEYKKRMFDTLIRGQNEPVTIPAHGYILATSLEYLRIPRFLKGRCVGKSTYARSGIIVNCTPLEPGWHGYLTIEISNSSPCPAIVYPYEGIACLEFEIINSEVKISYSDKKGKYQGQIGVTPPIVI